MSAWIDGRLGRAHALIADVYKQTPQESDAREVLKLAMSHLEDADCAMRYEQREPSA